MTRPMAPGPNLELLYETTLKFDNAKSTNDLTLISNKGNIRTSTVLQRLYKFTIQTHVLGKLHEIQILLATQNKYESLVRCYHCNKVFCQTNVVSVSRHATCLECWFKNIKQLNKIKCQCCNNTATAVTKIRVSDNIKSFMGNPITTIEYIEGAEPRHVEFGIIRTLKYETVINVCTRCGVRCEQCSRIIPKPTLCIEEPGCEQCKDIVRRLPFNAEPPLVYLTHRKLSKFQFANALFFGVELEYLVGDHDVYVATQKKIVDTYIPDIINHYLLTKHKEIKDVFYTMYDGSVEPGIEFATYPATWEMIKTKDSVWNKGVDKLFSELPQFMDITRLQKVDYCGLHIHVSKKVISHKTLYNLLSFIYANKPFMTTISNRDFDRAGRNHGHPYCAFDAHSTIEKSKMKAWHDKYTVVNLKKKKTIEFRSFKTTLQKEKLLSYLEFVHSLLMWARDVSHKDARSLTQYILFVKANRKEYPNLFEELKGTY